jgi:hypothetical protein
MFAVLLVTQQCVCSYDYFELKRVNEILEEWKAYIDMNPTDL